VYRFADLRSHTTPAVLAAVAAAHPERPFVIAEDATLSYGEAAERVATVADGLRAAGVRPGDRVGIALPNGARWCLALLATHAAGATALPLNTWFKPVEMAGVLRRAAPGVVLTERVIAERTGLSTSLAHCWERDARFPAGVVIRRVLDPLAVLDAAPVEETSDALLLFTSGSTAEPKAVRLSQAGAVRTAHAIGERQGIRADDRFWFALPLFFVFGCSNALPNALTHAATLCLQERFEPGAALEFLERHRCTVYYGVAPITRALVACPDLAHRDISALRTGTANATAEDLRLAIEVLGVRDVCNAYGLTEGHGHTTITAHTDPPEVRMACQGTVLPTQELRIVDGQIEIRGTITPGYLDAPDLNAAAFDANGWFRTGDLGRLDEHGRLHFVGRSHELIKAKGINVSPAEVEALLVGHPEVDEAFVFGVDLADGDQAVGAVLVAEVPAPEREQLIDLVTRWARERLSSYKVPTRTWILRRADLPLTATGKVSKRLLRDHLLRPATEPSD
jgi:fatty-acyl-CoA synthase